MPPTADGHAPLEISVVMPAFNEAGFLQRSVADVVGALRVRDVPFELIVIENGSRDSTAAIADGIAASTPEVVAIHLSEPDYGRALHAGLLAARGVVVVAFDVDYYDLDFADAASARLSATDQPAIVVGSKRAVGARDERAALRRLVTAVFSLVLRYAFGLQVSDTHGMKAMRREVVVPLAQSCRSRTDLFDTELVLRAQRAGLHVVELPVVVNEQRPSRSPIWRRVPRTLWGLGRLRITLWRERSRSSVSSPVAETRP